MAHRHERRNRLLGDLLGAQTGRNRLLTGLHQVPAATVVEGHRQGDAGVVLGQLLGLIPGRTQPVRQAITLADDDDSNPVTGQLGEVLGHRHEHQAHQARHLVLGSLPVLRRKSEHGEVLDTAIGAGLDHLEQSVDAGLVAEKSRQMTLLGPAAVAVHHDGHMAWYG